MSKGYSFKEAFVSESGRHDRDKGIVYGVLAFGLKSKNKREYTREAAKKLIPLVEQAAIYVDHTADNPLSPALKPSRSIKDRFARPKNISQHENGNLYCDLHYNKGHSFAEQFANLVDFDPVGVGLSMHGFTPLDKVESRPDGTKLIHEVTKLHSLDLVDSPATCVTLWEQAMPDTALDPVTGDLGTGSDWRQQLGELVKTVVADESLSRSDVRKRVMKIVKLLDDDKEAEPNTDTAMMEQLREIETPAVRAVIKRFGALVLKETIQQCRDEAVAAKLPGYAITEQFVGELASAPVEKRPGMLMDRHKLINAARPPISAPALKTDGIIDPNKKPEGEKLTAIAKDVFGA